MRLLAGALALGLMMAAVPTVAEAGHRHSRSCGHGSRYDSRSYRSDYRYGRSRDYRYDGRRSHRYRSYAYKPYRYYGPRYYRPYYYSPYYYDPYFYGSYGSIRLGGPRLGVYLNW
jgi:hypothetical protein